jgi:hypothetical protein
MFCRVCCRKAVNKDALFWARNVKVFRTQIGKRSSCLLEVREKLRFSRICILTLTYGRTQWRSG